MLKTKGNGKYDVKRNILGSARRWQQACLSLMMLVSLTTGVLAMTIGRANALSLPNGVMGSTSPSANQSSDSDHPWHNLILSNHGKVQQVKVGMYFATNAATSFTFDLDTSDCNINPISGYGGGKHYVYVTVGSIDYALTGNQICNGYFSSHQFAIPSSQLADPSWRSTGLHGVAVTIRWVSAGDASAPHNDPIPSSVLNHGNYNSACNGTSVGSGIRGAIAAQCDSGNSGSNFRFRFNLADNSGRVGLIDSSDSTEGNPNNSIVHKGGSSEKVFYPFGLRCGTARPVSNGEVTVYDADNRAAYQILDFYVGTMNANGAVTPLPKSAYVGSVTVTESAGGSRSGLGAIVQGSNSAPVFVPSDFNNVGGSTTVKIKQVDPNTKYVLVVEKMKAGQFIYVGLPGDEIYGDLNYSCPSYKLNSLSRVSNINGAGATAVTWVDRGSNLTFDHRVCSNTDSVQSATYTWRVQQESITPAGAQTGWTNTTKTGTPTGVGAGGCSPNLNGAAKNTVSTSSLAIGSRVCQRIIYNHGGGKDDATNSGSTMACAMITGPPICTITNEPDMNLYTGETATFTVTIQFQDIMGTVTAASITSNAGGGGTISNNGTATKTNGGLPFYKISQPVKLVAGQAAGAYSATFGGSVTYRATVGGVTATYTSTATCDALPYTVSRHPYVKVYGGDVQVGYAPQAADGSACKDTSAGIDSWNLGRTDGTTAYRGAGTQFGTQALNVIRGFVSAQPAGSGSDPYYGAHVSFANTANTGTADSYGGKFSNVDPLSCINYGQGLEATTGNQTLSSMTISGHQTMYIKGNVTINGPITYAGYTTLNTIPSFKLVVEGNIYIKGSVGRLDGIYIAAKNASGSGGNIYTCVDSSGVVPTTGWLIWACDNTTQLQVNGSLIAQNIHLLRAYGNEGDAASDNGTTASSAAEQILYSPETWLGLADYDTETNIEPDAIVSLPPAL